MPDTPSITINKVFTYRAQSEVYSNTYHFSGTTPANDADWQALARAIWASEKTFLDAGHKFAGYLGYAASNNHAVSILDLMETGTGDTPGTYTMVAGEVAAPGDSAMWVRWATPDRTSRGKRIYLRKYFHGVHYNANTEKISGSQVAALAAHGAKMTDGTLPGSAKVCGPQGAVAGAVLTSTFPTTRTLKRRGRRPSS